MLAQTVSNLGAAVRQRRLNLGMTQSQLAKSLRVNREWVIRFEKGNPGAALGRVLDAPEELSLALDVQEAPPELASPLDLM